MDQVVQCICCVFLLNTVVSNGVHGPKRMILYDFSNPLTCHLAPSGKSNTKTKSEMHCN